jgi:hypothetical protein
MAAFTTMALVGAGIGAAATVASSAMQSNAINKATRTSAQAADKSLAVQPQQYGETKANNAPFLATGTSALGKLAQIYGLDSVDDSGFTIPGEAQPQLDPNADFYKSPDYQFALNEGTKAINASAAARGMTDSGATRKAQIKYASNLASGSFNGYAGRLMELAGIGQSAANSQAGAGQDYANSYTNTVTNAANNQANAALAQGANYGSALQEIAGAARYSLGKNPFASSYGGGGIPMGQSSGPAFGWT